MPVGHPESRFGAFCVNLFARQGLIPLKHLTTKSNMRKCVITTMSKSADGTIAATSTVEDLLLHVMGLSPANQRAISAVVGAAVGDAATRPFHWLYDRTKLESIVGDQDPAFWPESVSPFYTLPTGRRSCYNDLGQCMLSSLHPHTIIQKGTEEPSKKLVGGFQQDPFVHTMKTMFAEESEYGIAFKNRQSAYDPNRRLEERVPVYGPWQQGAVTEFMKRVNEGGDLAGKGGSESKETDGLCVVLPLICRLSAEEVNYSPDTPLLKSMPRQFRSLLEEPASLLSTNPFALQHTLAAARILRNIIIFGGSVSSKEELLAIALDGVDDAEATEYLKTELDEVFLSLDTNTPHTDSVQKWGRQCANPGSFMGAVLSYCTSTKINGEKEGHVGYSEGIRRVIIGGGCNCSRSNLAGALLGAHFGLEMPRSNEEKDPTQESEGKEVEKFRGVPLEWMKKTDKMSEILYLAITNVACK